MGSGGGDNVPVTLAILEKVWCVLEERKKEKKGEKLA